MKRIRILAVLVVTVFLMTGCDALIELPEELKAVSYTHLEALL